MKIFFLLLLCLPAFADAPKLEAKLEGRKALVNPIVLVHGATVKGSRLQVGFLDFGDYFRGIKQFYEATGTQVYIAEVSTDGSVGERAAVLNNFLVTELKGRKANVIGHSLGGLDARYAATILKSPGIASITTIGTPHQGTPVADWAERQTKNRSGWYWLFRMLGYDMEQRRFLVELTTDHMQKLFNPKVPNREGIKYFSVLGSASFADGSMSYLLWFPNRWMEGENNPLSRNGHDGLVPLDSQSWGQEILRANLDHLGQMNHHEWRRKDEESEALRAYTAIYDTLLKSGL